MCGTDLTRVLPLGHLLLLELTSGYRACRRRRVHGVWTRKSTSLTEYPTSRIRYGPEVHLLGNLPLGLLSEILFHVRPVEACVLFSFPLTILADLTVNGH